MKSRRAIRLFRLSNASRVKMMASDLDSRSRELVASTISGSPMILEKETSADTDGK